MNIKSKIIKGGYRFRNFSGQPVEKIVEADIPGRVVIPLRQGFSDEVAAVVKIGDRVKAGQIIGRDDTTVSSPVHSSVNGVVEAVKKINYFKREVNAVVIKSDLTKEFSPLEGSGADAERMPDQAIEELLYRSGVTALDREGIPTRYKSSIIVPEEVETIIVHGVGSEVYNSMPEVLLGGKNIFHFVEGLKILKKVMKKATVYLAFNAHSKKLIEEIGKLTTEYDWIKRASLEPKYPQGFDEILVPTLLNKKFPYGYSAANIGIVILNLQAVVQAYEAVAAGKALIERTIALAGTCWKENVHVKVRIGTPLEDITRAYLKEGVKARIIFNSVLTGGRLNDLSLPVDKACSQLIAIPENEERRLLAFMRPGLREDSFSKAFLSSIIPAEKEISTNTRGEKRTCVTCGFCEEVCPVGIIPHLVGKYVERNIIDETIMRYKIFNCIDCNLCSYVCPSKIPLAQRIKEGREKLTTMGCDNSVCVLPFFDLKGLEEYRGMKK